MGSVWVVRDIPCVPTVSFRLPGLRSMGEEFDVVAGSPDTGTFLESCSGSVEDGSHAPCLSSGRLCVPLCLWC